MTGPGSPAAAVLRRDSRVRPFRAEDSPQVAELHARVFGTHLRDPEKAARRHSGHFSDTFLNGIWADEEIGSWVCENVDGRIVGFVGVSTRPLTLGGRRLRCAICSDFCVDRGSRGVPGVRLMKKFMSGPQDISFSDAANDVSRALWEGLGGSVVPLYSMQWLRILRPAKFAAGMARDRAGLRFAAALAGPAARALDVIAARILKMPPGRPPGLHACDLTAEALMGCRTELARDGMLRVEQTPSSLSWLLARARGSTGQGELQKALLRRPGGDIAGWYLYYLRRTGVSQVLEIGARRDCRPAVFEHLAEDAWTRGAVALGGRLESGVMAAVAKTFCVVRLGSPWTIVHSREAGLMDLFFRGEAVISRLEGEWARVPAPWCGPDFAEEAPVRQEPVEAGSKSTERARRAGVH